MIATTILTEAERIDAIEAQCRRHRFYSETLIDAIMAYLKGHGFAGAGAARMAARPSPASAISMSAFIALSNGANWTRLICASWTSASWSMRP